MATFQGRSAKIYEGSTHIANTSEWTLNVETPVESLSLIADGGTVKATGAENWNATVNCAWDDGATQQENLETALHAGTTVTIVFLPEGDTSGDDQITGTAYVSAYTLGVSGTGFVTRNFTLEGSGTLTHGTVT